MFDQMVTELQAKSARVVCHPVNRDLGKTTLAADLDALPIVYYRTMRHRAMSILCNENFKLKFKRHA